MTAAPQKHVYTRDRMLAWLDSLEAGSSAGHVTVSLQAGAALDDIKGHLKHLPARPEAIGTCAYHAEKSHSGAIAIFGPEQSGFLIQPPFPVTESCITPEIDVKTLRDMLARDYLVGFILVRLGAYAVGVCRGEKLVSSKAGTGLVHGRHKKGGSSAHRFERHRDKQIEYFFTRVCQRAREQLEPYVKQLDYLVFGGSREAIETARKQCDFIARLETPRLPPRLEIPDPRQPVLKSVVRDIWSSTVYEFREGD